MKILLLLAAATLVAASSAFAAPGVIIDDQFTDGAVTNGADALDTAWTGYTPGATTLGVATDATLGGVDALTFTTTAANKGIAANFTATTLAVGETLRLSFDFRFTNAPVAGGFRVALGNQVTAGTSATTDAGYYMVLGTGGTTTSQFYRDAGTDGSIYNGTATYLGAGTAMAINDQIKHQLTFSAMKTVSGYSLSYSFDNGTNTFLVNDNSGSFTSAFNTIAIANGNVINGFNVDNVNLSVTAVPEPSTYGLIGAGALAAVSVVRRRRKTAGQV